MTEKIITNSYGTKRWYKNNKLHREDGPAVECSDGEKAWYKNGYLHRKDGPAIETADGDKYWYKNGDRHREDGPAIELLNGEKSWFRSGYPFGISKDNLGVAIGCEQKRTIAEWDEWFAGTEEFQHPRDSKEFKVLLKLWKQFKKQCREISND